MSSDSTMRWVSIALFAVLLGTASTSVAQQNDTWGYKLSYELMSPYCPGRTLAQCTSPQAGELRQWIVMQEAAGATEEEVRANLLSRFGDAIRSTPKAEGWGLSAYVLPGVFFLLGGGIVVFFLQRMVRESQPADVPTLAAAPPPAPGSEAEEAELARRVDEELGLAS